jgi:uncharacterized caspase-like protein
VIITRVPIRIRGLGVSLLALSVPMVGDATQAPVQIQGCPYQVSYLSVGLDQAMPGRVARHAESDARLFVDFLREQVERESRPDQTCQVSQSGTVLTGERATKEAVREAFEREARKARPADLFAFFYGGISMVTNDGTRVPLASPEGCADLGPRCAVELRELKQWLDRVGAVNQLIVTEMGETAAFFKEFVSVTSESDPALADVLKRNRVVIAPARYGIESQAAGGGYLLAMLRETDFPLLKGPFTTDGRARLELALAAAQLRLEPILTGTDGQSYARVFYEREFMEYLLASPYIQGQMRSEVIPRIAAEADRRPGTGATNRALVIGTNVYAANSSWSELRNPVLDATTIAETLRTDYGFQVTLLVNADKTTILTALKDLQDMPYEPTDQVLIFFAGHGYFDERSQMGMLVASDSRSLATDRFQESYVDFARLQGFIDAIPAEHVLLMLDVCFGGAFSGRIGESGLRGDPMYENLSRDELVARKLRYRTRWYVTSGGREYVPDGRPGQHSPFARRVIDALRRRGGDDGILTLAELTSAIETIRPEPRVGAFGSNEPGSDFLFVAR